MKDSQGKDNRLTEKEYKPIEVRNRDIPLLAEILSIMQDITNLEKRMEWQKDRMLNITQHLTGMPGGKGRAKGLDDSFSLLSGLEVEHEARCKDYVKLLRKTQRVLNGIESRSMRTFVLMKYVMNVPESDIQKELNLTRRGLERAKNSIEQAPCMAAVRWHERYIFVQNR